MFLCRSPFVVCRSPCVRRTQVFFAVVNFVHDSHSQFKAIAICHHLFPVVFILSLFFSRFLFFSPSFSVVVFSLSFSVGFSSLSFQ